ncbi:PfaD family polyunsaturated fatty acid/polyketide biosynthesis protein [Gordonia soli]|uniref:Putative oxidoreductase n=1 Tax=Gordonia soli NBRC 108243 TaxID=1223545 RepID=M0QHH1_9ACTN|nr:PfaD family polyunsaturated fatty acid/polyketide biosynthesis protein [Gordonia soli]GAC67869.1 putative oxidoreductase [Gordonia soli NBRC 108243]
MTVAAERKVDGVQTRATGMRAILEQLHEPVYVVEGTDGVGLSAEPGSPGWEVAAAASACPPTALGSTAFVDRGGLRAPYLAGAMAGGIASVDLVRSMTDAGLSASFGSGGLPVDSVARALDDLGETASRPGFLMNLLHSPQDPDAEDELVDLLLRRRVRGIEASAFMGITPALARYRVAGLRVRDGQVVAENRVMAKVSRPELVRVFARPVPDALLRRLTDAGQVTAVQAQLAREVPVADEITAEADSGGHTDSRPLAVLLPRFVAERESIRRDFRPAGGIHIGAAGGLGTPTAVAAAFALGADYVVTGSVNQVCREAGVSDAAKKMLASAGIADFAFAPAADMFEIGAQVQVLKKSTMFASRAQRLRHLYDTHRSVTELSDADRAWLEDKVFRTSLDDAFADVRAYLSRVGSEDATGEIEPRRAMALLFRSYLGQSSRWARDGDSDRAADYQLWAGPALGAFNDWVAGSDLTDPSDRGVVDVAANLIVGAAYQTRVHHLRTNGVRLPASISTFQPRAGCAHLLVPETT